MDKRDWALRRIVVRTVWVGMLALTAVAAQAETYSRTQWARPLAGGPVRAIFLAPYGAHTDTHELTRRVDLAAVVIPVSSDYQVREIGLRGCYYPEPLRSAARTFEEIRGALAGDWEVLVVSDVPPWGKYPPDLRRAILASVAAGRGLITPVGEEVKKDLQAAGLTLEEMPGGAARFPFTEPKDGSVRVYRCGKGRIVHLQPDNDSIGTSEVRVISYLLSSSPRQADFEYSAARVGWYLRQAARPATRAVLAKTVFENGELVIRGASAAPSGNFKVTLHRRDNYAVLHRATVPAGPAVHVKLPYLGTGEYQVEMTAVDAAGGVVDWDAVQFSHVGPVKITSLTVDKKTVAAGDTISGSVKVQGPTGGLQLAIRWRDQWGRLLADTSRSFTESFTVKVPNGGLSVINHLEIALVSDRGPETDGQVEITTPAAARSDNFYVMYWNSWPTDEWRRRVYYQMLRQDGMADVLASGRSLDIPRAAALEHLRAIPYTTVFNSLTLDAQLLNENWQAQQEQWSRRVAQAHKPYNALAYTLGDENFVSFTSPEGRFTDNVTAWAAFRQFLRELYPDIRALNAQWDTSFSDWNAIRFKSERDMLKSLDNPSAWVDYRMFITRRFTDLHRRMRNAIRAEDPGACVGFDGCDQKSSYDGFDWYQFAREMDLVNVYSVCYMYSPYPMMMFNGEAARSFHPDAPLRGSWINQTDPRYGGQYDTWYLFLNGWNSVWWWQATYPNPLSGAANWDLTLNPMIRSMADAVRQIKRGPAALLAHAVRQTDPIAIYYSETNWHASSLESGMGVLLDSLGTQGDLWFSPSRVGPFSTTGPDKDMEAIWGKVTPTGHYAAATKNFYLLLHDLGYQPQMIARQQIEADELAKGKVRVLILPFAVGLSDAEAAKIRAFVLAGGTVIADYHCGLRDMHGRVRAVPALDDLFSIKHINRKVSRQRARVTVDDLRPGWVPPKMTYRGAKFERVFHDDITVTPTGRTRIHGYHDDGSPAFIATPWGEGNALFMNCDLYAYDEMRRRGQETDLRDLIGALLITDADVYPGFVPEHRLGHPIGQMVASRFRDGDTCYYGVLPEFQVDDKSAKPASLRFGPGRWVYDLRERKPLGRGEQIETVLEPGQAKLYAAVSYEIRGFAAAGPASIQRGQSVTVDLTVTGSTMKIGPHAARVEVIFPDGSRPEYLKKTVFMPNGHGGFTFVPALNDPTGAWTLEAVEAMSGKSARLTLTVK